MPRHSEYDYEHIPPSFEGQFKSKRDGRNQMGRFWVHLIMPPEKKNSNKRFTKQSWSKNMSWLLNLVGQKAWAYISPMFYSDSDLLYAT